VQYEKNFEIQCQAENLLKHSVLCLDGMKTWLWNEMVKQSAKISDNDHHPGNSWAELLDMAIDLDNAQRFDEALDTAEAAYDMCLDAGDIPGLLLTSRRIALFHFNREQLMAGLRACERVRIWADQCNDPGAIVGLLSVHGGILVELGDVETGFEMIHRSMRIANENQDLVALWRAQTAYAGSLFDTEDFAKAADAARESLKTLLKTDASEYMRLMAYSIAGRMITRAMAEDKLNGAFIDTAAMNEAQTLLEDVLAKGLAGGYHYEIAEGNCYLGVLAWICGENEMAADRLSTGMIHAIKAQDDTLTAELAYWISAQFASVDAFDPAREYLERVERIVLSFEGPRRKMRYYKARSHLEASAGMWRDAYEFQKLYHEQVVLDFKRLASARAHILQVSLELEYLRKKESEARTERLALMQENAKLAKERNILSVEAVRDPLSDLGNRRELDLRRQHLVEINTTHCGVLLLDIDHFKTINDIHSHATGDDVIKQMARLLTAGLRNQDVPIRLGGEEFVVLLPQADLETSVAVAERLRLTCSGYDWAQIAPDLRVTCSIGIALWRPQSQDFDLALKDADRNMYVAKRQGRNRSVYGQ
jgi:diguanylate cyclase (GGDEF)-like protein